VYSLPNRTPSTKTIRSFAAATVIVCTIFAAQPAHSTPAAIEPADRIVLESVEAPPLSAEEALASDARMYVREHGTTLQEATIRLEWQMVAGEVAETVKGLAAGRYAGSWIDNGADWRLVIRVAQHKRITALESFAEQAPIPMVIDYGAPRSEQQLAREAERLAETLRKSTAGIDGVGVDVRAGGLVVIANPDAPQAVATSVVPDDVPVHVERSKGRAINTNRGGVNMSTCTAGFSVVTSDGRRGLTTAGHCSDTQAYATTPTGTTSNSSTYQGQSWDADSDVQWHRLSNHSPSNTFFGSSSTSATTRTGSGQATMGQLLCHRGRASGYSCGNVTSTTFAPTWSAACGSQTCRAVFVRVEGQSLANLRGDSGGPWFSGGNAIGTHMGGQVGEVAVWATFTPVARLADLGVGLL